MTKFKSMEICQCCGRKARKCSSCGATQTKENTTITWNGRWNSTCKECTRKRVLEIKYKKMTYAELVTLRDEHLKNAQQVSQFMADNFRQGGA
jgi:hypothetical protein